MLRYSTTTNCAILVLFGAKIGETFVRIHSPVTLHGFGKDYSNLEIGNGCLIGGNNYLDLSGRITLREGVSLGPGVTIMTHNRYNYNKYLETKLSHTCGVGDVIVGEGTGVKAHAVITMGVKVGKNAVIAGGALVNRDIPDYHFVGGVPAKTIRVLTDLDSDPEDDSQTQ